MRTTAKQHCFRQTDLYFFLWSLPVIASTVLSITKAKNILKKSLYGGWVKVVWGGEWNLCLWVWSVLTNSILPSAWPQNYSLFSASSFYRLPEGQIIYHKQPPEADITLGRSLRPINQPYNYLVKLVRICLSNHTFIKASLSQLEGWFKVPYRLFNTPLVLLVIFESTWERHIYQFHSPHFLLYDSATQQNKRSFISCPWAYRRERERENWKRTGPEVLKHRNLPCFPQSSATERRRAVKQNHSLVFPRTSFKQLSQSYMYVALGTARDA